MKLNTIEEALADFKAGKFVIVVDDEDRENEGDLICAAEKITPEMVNFMLKNARGVLCAPVTISRAKELARDISVRYTLRTMVCCAAQVTQRLPSTCVNCRGSTLPAPSSKS